MALTVTATINNSSSDGIALAVRVLTSAAAPASQPGVTFEPGAVSGNPPQYNPTPTGTGSYIYGAAVYGPLTTATVDANTTAILNTLTSLVALFLFRSTGKTTSGTAVLYGGSAPTLTAGSYVMCEILASGTLAEDASTPAAADTASGASVTSASFSPPAGALLVAVAAGFTGVNQLDSLTITDTLGLTWTQAAVASGGSSEGVAGVWVAQVPASFTAPPNRPRGQAVNRASTY